MSEIFNSIIISQEVKDKVDKHFNKINNMTEVELCLAFLEYVENNYYYSSSCWSNCETDEVKSRKDIYQEFIEQLIL
jgi:hypothetical protein